MQIGIINPGAMGVSIAASAQASGHELYWVAEGRSEQSRARAAEHQLHDAGSLEQLCARCSIILSVCPPPAAEAVAQAVAEQGFDGLYLDANAISPQRARQIEAILNSAGARFVDGSIIGGPAWTPAATMLYLAGADAPEIAALFKDGPLATTIMEADPGAASALKMCYAAYSKGTTALLTAILAAAQALEVEQYLQTQWQLDGSELEAQASGRARRVTAKAWRYVGEMEEIAATFAAVGLPGGFHQAAAKVYQQMAHFKDASQTPELAQVLAALLYPQQAS